MRFRATFKGLTVKADAGEVVVQFTAKLLDIAGDLEVLANMGDATVSLYPAQHELPFGSRSYSDTSRDRVGENIQAEAAADTLPGTQEAAESAGESCATYCRNDDCDHVVVDGCYVAPRPEEEALGHVHDRREDLTCAEHDCSNCGHKDTRWAEGETQEPCASCTLTSVDNEGPDCYWEAEVTADPQPEPLEPHTWDEATCMGHTCPDCGNAMDGKPNPFDTVCDKCKGSDVAFEGCHFTPVITVPEAAEQPEELTEERAVNPLCPSCLRNDVCDHVTTPGCFLSNEFSPPETTEHVDQATGDCTEVPVQKSFMTPEEAQQEPVYDPFAASSTDNEDGRQEEDGEEAENPFLQPA